jgi:hypothetical protein
VSFMFSTALHLSDEASVLDVAVDQHRTWCFMNSQRLEFTPVWPMTLISSVRPSFLARPSFRCMCEARVHSGWVCSHMLVFLALCSGWKA